MARKAFAVWCTLVGLIVGLLGNILFFGHHVGLSFPLFMLAIIILLLASSRPAGQQIQIRNLCPLVPTMFFATMVVFRADPIITVMNVVTALGLSALTAHHLLSDDPLDEQTLTEHVAALGNAGAGILGSTGPEYADALAWWKEHGWRDRPITTAILRGLIITIPVVIVFGVLLGSADVVFGQHLANVWNTIVPEISNPATLLGRLIFVVLLSWLMTGTLSYGLARRTWETYLQGHMRPLPQEEDDAASGDRRGRETNNLPARSENLLITEKPKLSDFKLGIIESGMLLGAIDLLFGVFVLIQFTYFFGGEKNIEGHTYAEYARRGFFELVAVSVLTLGLVLALDRATIRREARHHLVFRGLAAVVVILMGIMLLSASQRMALYEDAFGFTHLRVYVHVFIFWLGVLFVAFTLEMFRVKTNVFSLGALLAIIGFLVTLNLMNVDLYIADQNMNRFNNGKQLDVCYLRGLSVDAVPAMIQLRDSVQDSETIDHVEWWLRKQLHDLESIYEDDFALSYNWSRDRAWNAVRAIRDTLPATYDSYGRSWGCSTYAPR